jgi:hypothetical protein
MKTYFIAMIFCFGFFVSCTPQYSYFTKTLYEKEKWTKEDIQRIQFYVSRDIILTRDISEDETSIQEGKIRMINGRKVQQVIIRQGTPGVLVFMPRDDRFAISFEENDNEAYLMFGPNPKYEDRFALLAQDWERNNGKVHYKGQLYDVDAGSAFAALMVDLRREGQSQYQTKRVEGRTIKG